MHNRFTQHFALSICTIFILFALLASCAMPGSNSITSELLRPVAVNISGTIRSVDTNNPVAGLEIRVRRVTIDGSTESFIQDGETDALCQSGADGSFAFTDAISLSVDTYQHYLHISDPDGEYFDNDSTVIYSMRDGSLEYNELIVVPLAPASFTVVSGTVTDLVSSVAVEGLTVSLSPDGSDEVYTTLTGADGSFSINQVPVTVHTLSLDGSSLATPYIQESSRIVLENSSLNQLGELLVSPESDSDDLRIVLSWSNSSLNLDSYLSLPKPNFIFNHLGTKKVELPNSGLSVNPAFKFAEGSAYWPENMGGDDSNRVTVGPAPANLTHTVNAQTVAALDADSLDGVVPELTTLYQRNPKAQFPSNLAYHYDFTRDSTLFEYYPVGMAVYNVVCKTLTGSIYDSGAQVKVYQGAKYLGTFTVADLSIDQGESNRRYWPVLQIEIGFTTNNPTSDEDVYFRVVPFGSGGALPDDRFPGFFWQETRLPGNASFTTFLDQAIYGRDYYFVPPPALQQVFLSRDGGIFNRPVDYTSGSFPRIYLTDSPVLTHGVYWMNSAVASDGPVKANDLFITKQVADTTGTPVLRAPASGEGSEMDAEVDLTQAVLSGVRRVNDSALVRFRDQNYGQQSFLLLATSEGPRAASTIRVGAYEERTPMLDAWHPGLNDLTAGAVLSTGAGRIMNHVLAARERDGTVGRFALIGGQGLFRFLAGSAVYDSSAGDETGWTTGSGMRADFRAVASAEINLSDPNYSIRAIAEFPTLGPMHYFYVAARDEVSGDACLFRVETDESGSPGSPLLNITELIAPSDQINCIKFVKVGFIWGVLVGTDNGVYFSVKPLSTDPQFTKYLPGMLDDFKVTDIFDYNGMMGLFAENNGLIYGPWPQ